MKQLKFTLFVLGILMLSIIDFYAFNLLFAVVGNHESLDLVSLTGIPMILLLITLVICLMAGYRYLVRKDTDIYYVRYYAIVEAALSVVGIGTSIFVGAGIYGSFVKDCVFKCYPLIMLIVFILMLGGSIYLIVDITKRIKAENIEKTYHGKALTGLIEAGFGILIVYALDKLGAFVLLPIYWSSYDSVYVLPYLFQLLVPTVLVIMRVLYKDFVKSDKVRFIMACSVIGYSLFSILFMALYSKGKYPLTVNPLTPIQQLGRLVCYPISTMLLYGLSFAYSAIVVVLCTIKYIKAKKAA